jgi:phosphatidylglycerophosphatase A
MKDIYNPTSFLGLKIATEKAKKALSQYSKNYSSTDIPKWILDESVGYNYEQGLQQDEIIAFLAGFLNGFSAFEEKIISLENEIKNLKEDFNGN